MKTTKKLKARPESIPCFECDKGTLQPVLQDYFTTHPRLGNLTIPAVPMLRCDCCGDTVSGEEGNTYIDAFLAKALNVISPKEIQAFLDKYKLTQKRAAEITGYGEKNISRWLSGHSRPSESVSNFLRVLLAERSAFERLLMKNFPETVKSACPAEERQPDEEEKEVLKLIDYKSLVRIGAVASGSSSLVRRTELCRLLNVSDLISFRDAAESKHRAMAAFKDTKQHSTHVSGAIWIELGLRAAEKVEKAREAVAMVAKRGAVALVAVTAVEEPAAVVWAAARAAVVTVVTVEEAREGAMADESSAVRSRCNQCQSRTALACHTKL